MKRPCCYTECCKRRAHYEMPDEERGVQYIEVPFDYPEDKPAFCSITCAVMAGAMKLTHDGYVDSDSEKEQA